MSRLFVCAWPPPHVRLLLAALPRPDIGGVRWVAERDWHVTLRFIGDARIEHAVDAVTERLATAALPAATLVLGPAVGLLSDRHVVVPVAGADALAAAVRGATAGLGELDRHHFRGHLTLARLGRGVPPPTLLGASVGGEFEVDRVALVASELLPGPSSSAARYTTLASFATT